MNHYIRNLYSPGFSSVALSFFKTNLSISFAPWVDCDPLGRNAYDKSKFLSTTVNDENAAALYFLVKRIAEGSDDAPVQYVIPCNSQTTLTFQHDLDSSTLAIEKQGEKITFEFVKHRYKTKEGGKVVEKVILSGLLVFAEVLNAYLTAVSSDRLQYNQFGEVYNEPQNYSSGWM